MPDLPKTQIADGIDDLVSRGESVRLEMERILNRRRQLGEQVNQSGTLVEGSVTEIERSNEPNITPAVPNIEREVLDGR